MLLIKILKSTILCSVILGATISNAHSKNLTEKQLESFFRGKTISGNYAAAIKIRFTLPLPGVAYIGTIHGYPNNLSVCEQLIEPYNVDKSLTTIPGSVYFCEELK